MRLRFLLSPVILLTCLWASPVPAADAARFAQGLAAYDAGRYDEAYKIFVAIADDDVAATRNVAVMLRKGLGVKKDPIAAQLWLARAAKGGLLSAAADLGEMLLDGEAGKPNPEAAFGWLSMAAQAGYPTAAYRLAGLYETGVGTKKDIEAARLLYAFAMAGKVPGAQAKLYALPPPPPEPILQAVEITPAQAIPPAPVPEPAAAPPEVQSPPASPAPELVADLAEVEITPQVQPPLATEAPPAQKRTWRRNPKRGKAPKSKAR